MCKYICIQVLYGVNAADGGAPHTSILKFLRKMPFCCYNASARGWSLRIEDYAKAVAAIKSAGLVVKGGKACKSAARLDRPPEAMLKALTAQSWPLVQSADVEELLKGIPARLRAALLPFQAEGVAFAVGRGGRCLLADEMGLGKTVQGIAVAAAYRADWPLLIICPSSLRLNWKHELSTWLPGEEAHVILSGVEADRLLEQDILPNITIISYDLMATRRAARLQSRWQCVIADESHYIKNSKSLRSKACVPILQKARRALLLTGTPALSRPVELFTQVSCLQPKMFTSKKAFEDRFCARKQGRYGVDASGASNLRELNLVLSHTMMVRRLKRDVLTQLPSKRRQQVFVPIAPRAAAELKKSLALLDKLPSRRGAPSSYPSLDDAEVEEEGEGREGGEDEGQGDEEGVTVLIIPHVYLSCLSHM